MSQEQSKALVLRFYKGLDEADYTTWDLLASNFVAHVTGAQGPMDRDTFIQFALAFGKALPDGKHVFDEIIVDKDRVVTVGAYQGTHRGELQGIPPTGNRISLSSIRVDRVSNGMIVEHRALFNMVDLMQQLGVTLQPKKSSKIT